MVSVGQAAFDPRIRPTAAGQDGSRGPATGCPVKINTNCLGGHTHTSVSRSATNATTRITMWHLRHTHCCAPKRATIYMHSLARSGIDLSIELQLTVWIQLYPIQCIAIYRLRRVLLCNNDIHMHVHAVIADTRYLYVLFTARKRRN